VSRDGQVCGELEPTGVLPECLKEIEFSGFALPVDIFTKKEN
jgi:hypothetical protein